MCLDTVTHRLRKHADCVAWKIFDVRKKRLRFRYQDTGDPVPRRQWLTAKRSRLDEGGDVYFSGFHCYTTEQQAAIRQQLLTSDTLPVRVVKVRVRGVRLLGRQDECDVLVADEMWVP